jgi:hypothetical protein
MRHIPEDELHAYLDQGLSRSQCVEIESHLAVCHMCRIARDGIAALRDRTTALLTRLAPPRSIPPSFEALERQATLQRTLRRRRIHAAVWAASLMLAVGLGWMGNRWTTSAPETATTIAPQPITSSAQTSPPTPPVLIPVAKATSEPSSPVKPRPASRRPARRAVQPAEVDSPATPPAPVMPPPALELSSVDIPDPGFELELGGMWRTLSWDGARAEAGDKLPHIGGLPVVQVQLQASEQGKQPLMVVAQQLASGEVIRTIEGPTSDVSQLLSRRTMTDPPTAGDSTRSRRGPPGPSGGTMAMQRGDRLLVITGALPQDSLLAMIRRMNAEMRSK